MANAFTRVRAWTYGGPAQKSIMMVEGTLVIDTTANGGAAVDDLPASLFGLKQIIGIACITNDGEDKIYFGAPDYTGDSLLVGGIASLGVLADLPNDTYKVCIQGYY